MEYTAVNLFHVAAFEVKALVASIVPNLKLDFFSKLITPLVRKFAILFPLFLVVVTFIHNWVEPVIGVNSKEPEVDSLARLTKLRHLLDRLRIHVPEEAHPRGEGLCLTFVLIIKARRDHEEIPDDEDAGDAGVLLVQSHHTEPIGGAVIHPVVHKLQPVNVLGLHVRPHLCDITAGWFRAECSSKHGVCSVLLKTFAGF